MDDLTERQSKIFKLSRWFTRARNIFPLYLLVGLAILGSSYYYYFQERITLLNKARDELATITQFKAWELENWLNQRKSDAIVMTHSQLVTGFLDQPNAINSWPGFNALLHKIQTVRKQYQYQEILFLDNTGKLRYSTEYDRVQFDSLLMPLLSKANTPDSVVISDLYLGIRHRHIRLDFVAPVFKGEKEDLKKLGYVILRMDARDYLFPMIAQQPSFSQLEEIDLLQKTPKGIFLFKKPLDDKGLPQELQINGSDTTLAEVRAFTGHPGLYSGPNAKGEPTMSFSQPIKATSWMFFTQQLNKEIYKPLRRRMWFLSVFVFLIAIAVGTVVLFIRQAQLNRTLIALQESERKFREMVVNLDEGVFSITADGTLLEYNQAYKRILEIPQGEEPRGSQTRGLWKNKADRKQYLDDLNLHQSIANYPVMALTQSGREINLLTSAHIIRDEKGNTLRIEGVIHDITDRVKAEEQIRRLNNELEMLIEERTKELIASEKSYREIFELSPVAIMKEDWSDLIAELRKLKQNGISDLVAYVKSMNNFEKSFRKLVRLVDGNNATLKLLGVKDKTQLHSSAKAIFWGNAMKFGFKEMVIALINQESVMETDIAIRNHQGKMLRLLVRVVFPREESGSGIVLMTMTDITERVNALEDLQRSRLKLLEANRELESFSYTVSHDLRAPLRSVIGYSHMLREDYGERLDEEGLRLCRIIDSSAVKMGRLIDDLLEFSRFGRSELHNEMIHMETLASRVFFEITTPEERTRIRFIVQELPRIMGDLMMIKQVWVNLISNAIKYSSKQSKATITIGAKNGDKENIYYVSDNGIGFDIQYADKLFGVFQRLHSTKEFEGTGVGLAIVQRILERHGGRVYADGKVGEGATFYFAMPKTDNLP